MVFLLDFFPVVVFFIAYYIPEEQSQRLFVATAAIMVAIIIQVLTHWLIYRKVKKMHLITLAIILILGGATLLTQDKRFFLWKPTIVNWLFALVFVASEWIGNKPIIQRMLEETVHLPAKIWLNLNRMWTVFFLFLGGINLYVAYYFSEQIWVNFKLFGMLGLTLLFTIAQAIYLSIHAGITTPQDNSLKEEILDSKPTKKQ